MQFTKPMIELVYEIRRRTPSELKPSVKLANPELFEELKNYYYANATAVSKALIKELFLLAGPEWATLLYNQEKHAPKQTVKVYRGQTIFKDRAAKNERSSDDIKKRVYRGRVITA